jgi:hypothetical protein
MKVKKLLFVLALFIGLNVFGQVTPTVPNLDLVVNVLNNSGADITGVASAIDYVTGAVYCVGYSNTVSSGRDLVLVKLDSNLVQQWIVFYDFNSGHDRGNALYVDASGNVYVTGESQQSAFTNSDAVTIKYDASGNLVWSARFNGTSNTDDCGKSIGVDGSGNVFITGYTGTTAKGKDFLIAKYNSSGTFQSAIRRNGSANADESGEKLVISGSYLYATGSINNTTTNQDVLTMCINISTSVPSWTTVVNGSANGNDTGYDIKLDGTEVFVCGKVNNTTTNDDYYFARMSQSTGAIKYSDTYDGYNGSDLASALVPDKLDNYAVTGLVANGSNTEVHTRLHDTSSVLWTHVQPVNGSYTNGFPKIATDTIAKHFYVSFTYSNTTLNGLLYQLTPSGTKSWTQYHDGAGGARDIHADLVLDGLGRIYLCSANETGTGTGIYDYVMMRYSQTPVYFPPDTLDVPDKNYIFQKNDGQLHHVNGSRVPESEVGYYYQGKSPSVYINNNRVSYLLLHQLADSLPADSSVRVDMNFVSSNTLTSIYAYDTVSNYYNYFIDSISPVVNVRGYNRVFIPNVWNLTDVHHSSNTNGLKSFYCFKLTEAVYTHEFNIDGADTTYINGSGELIAETPLGIVNIGGVRGIQIDSTFTPFSVTTAWTSLGGDSYRFSITGLHPFLPLIIVVGKTGASSGSAPSNIDNLYWSTYIGDVGNEDIHQSEIDAKDQLYTIGYTYSNNFPTTAGAYISSGNNLSNRQFATYSKFNSSGRLIYSTYYGSAGYYNVCGGVVGVEGFDITVDSLYNIYIVGKTNSSTLPVTGPGGSMTYTNAAATGVGGTCQNAFIAKFDSTGNGLKWASYFGGTSYEMFSFVKYGFGNIICGGNSTSSSIPLVSPAPYSYQVSTGRGCYLRLDTTGQLLHNTKLKGEPKRADWDKDGNAYIVGTVQNLDPTSPVQTSIPGAYQQGWAGGASDWFIHKFSPSDSLTWATNVGGGGYDICSSLCIRDTLLGICGYGFSYNFPFLVAGSDSGDVAPKTFTSSPSFTSDEIQMAKFNIKTGKRIWVAYHATVLHEEALDLSFDSDYNMYITGKCWCPNGSPISCVSGNPFRILQAPSYYYQSTRIGTEAFVLAFDKNNQRKWLTFFGASIGTVYNSDIGNTMSINSKNQLFSCGSSYLGSSSLPLSRWNSTCYYDSTSADISPNQNADGYITMFDVSNFTAIGIVEHSIPVKSNSFILFPNPNSGSFTIQLNENIKESVNIQVFNTLGQNVYSVKNIRDKREIPLQLNSLKEGIYFVNLSNQNFNETVKFIVQ